MYYWIKWIKKSSYYISISISIHDGYGNEIPIQTNFDHPFEFIIPWDPNTIIPSMTLENVP